MNGYVWGGFLFLVLAIWGVLALRYGRASRRWFNGFVEREAERTAPPARGFNALSPREFVRRIAISIQYGPLLMFRQDPEARVDALRREAVSTGQPLFATVGALIVLAAIFIVGVALFLLVAGVVKALT